MEGKTLRKGKFEDKSGKLCKKGQQEVRDQRLAMAKSSELGDA